MNKNLGITSLLLLAGCSTYPPGADSEGQRMLAAATPVLDAIAKYMDDTARPPKSLNVLVPKYLPSIPDTPKIDLNLKENVLTFKYIQSASHHNEVICTAFMGETEWSCDIPISR